MAILQDRIKQRRLALSLTLLQVAEELGVKEATVQRYESGEIKNIKHETIYNLSRILKCDPSYLMGWSNEIAPVEKKITYLSERQKMLLHAYETHPEVQHSVNLLLGLVSDASPFTTAAPEDDDRIAVETLAARSTDDHYAADTRIISRTALKNAKPVKPGDRLNKNK